MLCCSLLLPPQSLAQESTAYYEIDSLNTGLGPKPDAVDNLTPRGALEALLDSAKTADWDAAAHLLDLSDIEPGQQKAKGAGLARKLHMIIDRKAVINWGALLDRPDALDARATSDSAVAGQPRRSILLWSLPLEDRSVSIRLNRVKPNGEDAVWVFSRQTLDNVDPLYQLYKPSWLEEQLPIALRQDAAWDMMWWEIIALPIVLLLAIIVGVLVHRGVGWLSHRVDRPFFGKLIATVRFPLVVVGVTSVLAVMAKQLFVFSGPIDTVLDPLVVLGYLVASMTLVINIVDVILNRIVTFEDSELREIDQKRNRELATKLSAGRKALIVLIFVVGAGMVLAAADVLQSFGFSLLASAGALTLVLAFAARKILGNIMASMQIAINQSARIGDRVLFREHLCDVERINFTYVQLRVWTGERLIVPVEEFVSEPFENWSLQEPQLTRLVRLKLAHDADTDAMRKSFFDIVEEGFEAGDLGDKDDLKAVITAQDVFGKEMTFCLPCANPNTAWAMECELRERLINAARKHEGDNTAIFPEVTPAEAA